MNSITKTFSIENWTSYTPCEVVGDTRNMVKVKASTVINGRPAMVTTWMNEITGEGFGTDLYPLNSGELA